MIIGSISLSWEEWVNSTPYIYGLKKKTKNNCRNSVTYYTDGSMPPASIALWFRILSILLYIKQGPQAEIYFLVIIVLINRKNLFSLSGCWAWKEISQNFLIELN